MHAIPVLLARMGSYDDPALSRVVAELLAGAALKPARGSRVLVKPNLVAARTAHLSTTHPAVVRAACLYLLDHGVRVTVADSPAFGSARSVARKSGLLAALEGLPVSIQGLSRPAKLKLSFGASIGVSRDALEAGAILSLPKVKAHNQMRLTCAVKNLFGCVVGGRKAWAHCRFGDRANHFEAMLLEVAASLPPAWALVDGIVAMSGRGPTGGTPCALGLLGASADPHGLDTAVYAVLGAAPEEVPLWQEARRRGLPGAFLENLSFPLLRPGEIDSTGFVIPPALDPVTFDPFRLIKGRVKSVCQRFL